MTEADPLNVRQGWEGDIADTIIVCSLRLMDSLPTDDQSLRDFLAKYEIKFEEVPTNLLQDLCSGDLSYDSVWAWCQLGALFGRSRRATPILCSLLVRDDHEGHDDLADTLQNLRDPRSVGCLFDRTQRRLPYLDCNDSSALARRCVWALHDIGTEEALAKLEALAKDPREEVAGEAVDRLLSVREEHGDPKPYRLARDAAVGAL